MKAWLTYLIASVFAYWSSRFFGHNMFPQTVAELAADGFVCLLVVIGMLIDVIERKRP